MACNDHPDPDIKISRAKPRPKAEGFPGPKGQALTI
jgi:hypothetical protein